MEEFGITFKGGMNPSWMNVSEYEKIGRYGEKYNRTISWLDEGEQPEDEWLYLITFPTGPYALHADYPEDTFKKLWDELKGFGPKYCDTRNSNMYFTAENSSGAHKAFAGLLKKYRAEAEKEARRVRIKKMKDDLAKMEASMEEG
jgi:hypothetical protein